LNQSIDTLVELNRRGIFPSPGQSEEVFWKKAAFILNRPVSFLSKKWESFDLDSSWVFVVFERKGLPFWEVAALWQERVDPFFTVPQIQIASGSSRFCSEEERIVHEMVHAARVDFEEDRFEEILAYATSLKRWRCYLGPFFRKPFEVWVFISLLITILGVQILSVAWGIERSDGIFLGLLLGLIGVGWIRLHRAQAVFKKCLNKMVPILKDSAKKLAFLIRLSDWEICFFAKRPLNEILHFIEEERRSNFRWRLLATYIKFEK
jgi:hypothetical protein